MAYRKGYYRKDGTYVEGHFVNSGGGRSRKNSGCVLSLMLLIAVTSILTLML